MGNIYLVVDGGSMMGAELKAAERSPGFSLDTPILFSLIDGGRLLGQALPHRFNVLGTENEEHCLLRTSLLRLPHQKI